MILRCFSKISPSVRLNQTSCLFDFSVNIKSIREMWWVVSVFTSRTPIGALLAHEGLGRNATLFERTFYN